MGVLAGRPLGKDSGLWQYTPIDALSLFDKFIVHEVYSHSDPLLICD